MAVTWMTGFEGQQATGDPGDVGVDNLTRFGTTSYNTAIVRTGAASLRCNLASSATGYIEVGTASNYQHFGFYIASLPTLDRIIAGTTAAGTINVRLTSTGALAVYLSTTLIGTSAALSTSAWHWIGVRQVTGTSVVFLQVDGVNEVTGTATVTAVSNVLGLPTAEASAIDVYYDDVIGDGAGFLAASKVALLKPISDVAQTNWRKGGGTTTGTDFWEAINNIPPAGVASANETDTTNIESASSTGTATYKANLQTYTTGGVGAADTVLAVRTVVHHGEDISTGTKTGSTTTTNPTIAAVAFDFGSAAAHLISPDEWECQFGTIQASPSVTLGTSPTIEIIKTDTTTRVACVDFLGLLVAWTPAAAAVDRVPFYRPMTQLLAH